MNAHDRFGGFEKPRDDEPVKPNSRALNDAEAATKEQP